MINQRKVMKNFIEKIQMTIDEQSVFLIASRRELQRMAEHVPFFQLSCTASVELA